MTLPRLGRNMWTCQGTHCPHSREWIRGGKCYHLRVSLSDTLCFPTDRLNIVGLRANTPLQSSKVPSEIVEESSNCTSRSRRSELKLKSKVNRNAGGQQPESGKPSRDGESAIVTLLR